MLLTSISKFIQNNKRVFITIGIMKFVYYVMLFLYPAVCFKRGKDSLEAGNKFQLILELSLLKNIERLFDFGYNNG